MSDVMIHSFMPRNILDSDDDGDSWSLGTSSGCRSQSSESSLSSTLSSEYRDPNDFRLFQDYFGLSNLLNNVKISEDNPLLYSNHRNLGLMSKVRRVSWDSDGSDPSAVLSPTIENPSCNYDRVFDMNNNLLNDLSAQLPPPSMRLSKAMREHIISGAYQQQVENRQSEKFTQPTAPPTIPASPTGPQPNQRQSPSTNTLNPVIPSLPPPPTALPRLAAQPSMQVCVFCRNNGESESVYSSHVLKDAEGRTSCPILRAYTCPICKANGDSSHTIKYCPMNQNSRPSSGPMSGIIPSQNPNTVNNLQRNQPPRPIANFRGPFNGNMNSLPQPQQRMNQHGKIR